MSDSDTKPKRKRGRPEKPIPRIDETPERVAKAIFSAVKPPNPMRRRFNVNQGKQKDK